MKKKNQNRSIIFQAILLFIDVFIIFFIGFVICNIFAIAIDCIFNGFDNFITVIKNMRTEKARNAYSVQFSHSVVSDSLRPHESQHARPPCPSPTLRVHGLKLMSIESVMPSSHLILCPPLLLLPQIPPSIRVFSSESTLRMR